MKAKEKLGLAVFVVGYLCFAIALYWYFNRPVEGFQTCSVAGCTLNLDVYAGRRAYLCETRAQADTLSLNSCVRDTDAICFLPEGDSNQYVCYQRPPRKVFNPGLGVLETVDVTEDSVPDFLPGLHTTTCTSAGTAKTALTGALQSTLQIVSTVNTGYANLGYVKTNLETLLTENCRPPRSAAWSNACGLFSNASSEFTGYLNNPALSNISTTTTAAARNMQALYDTVLVPAFAGTNC